MQQVFSVAASSSGRANVPYDESLEAKNRDACKIMAEYYNNALKKNYFWGIGVYFIRKYFIFCVGGL